MEKYAVSGELGQGTFGVVLRATQRDTGRVLALKRFVLHDRKEGFPITAFREITILKKLKHVNVIQILEVLHSENSFYTVAPYVSSDLNGLIHNPNIHLDISQIKCVLHQILQGVNHIHGSGYLHRDIKSANILLDCFGVVKIADFGLARKYHGPAPSADVGVGGGGGFVEYTGVVVTRWYRAPELLLGDRKYTTAIDIWGVGCVFAEMFIKRPLFEGKSDLHQSELIFQLMGSPTVETYPNCHLVNSNNVNLKIVYNRSIESHFNDEMLGEGGLQLLSQLLELDPGRRLNAEGGLASNWFKLNPVMANTQRLAGLEDSHESDVSKYDPQQKQGTAQAPQANVMKIPSKPKASVDNSNNPWKKPVSMYNYDINSKRDREDPYFFASNGGKRQRQRGPLYGSSESEEKKRLGLLRGMLHKKGDGQPPPPTAP